MTIGLFLMWVSTQIVTLVFLTWLHRNGLLDRTGYFVWRKR